MKPDRKGYKAGWYQRNKRRISEKLRFRTCKGYLLQHGNLPDAKRAALADGFYVQASVWETTLGKLIEKRINMNTGEGQTTAAPTDQAQETTNAAQEGSAGNENQATTESTEKAEEPARTIAAATPVEASRAVAGVAPGSRIPYIPGRVPPGSSQNAVVIRRLVTYVPGDDDVSHGVNAAGIGLAAIIVKVNEDDTVNLHVFAADSAATLFKANVSFGALSGQCHF